jgi:hypothetical protein
MMVAGGKKSPQHEIVAMCKAGGVHGQLNLGIESGRGRLRLNPTRGDPRAREETERARERDLAAAAKVATTLAATAFGS